MKDECQRLLNLLRAVSSNKWGADQYTLVRIYRALLLAKIDYGCIVYGSAAKSALIDIEVIAREALKIAVGAFKSTPYATVHVLANDIPLMLGRDLVTLNYFIKQRNYLFNPAFNYAVPNFFGNIFTHRHLTSPFCIIARAVVQKMNISTMYIKAAFSCRLLSISVPSWNINLPTIDTTLARYLKANTTVEAFVQLFKATIEQYSRYTQIYTDGSKCEDGVGAAAICEGRVLSNTLPHRASIISAELQALTLAIGMVEASVGDSVILTESRSALAALANREHKNPIVRKLQYYCHELTNKGGRVVFCWVPRHVCLAGNEAADSEAKRPSGRPPEYIPPYYRD